MPLFSLVPPPHTRLRLTRGFSFTHQRSRILQTSAPPTHRSKHSLALWGLILRNAVFFITVPCLESPTSSCLTFHAFSQRRRNFKESSVNHGLMQMIGNYPSLPMRQEEPACLPIVAAVLALMGNYLQWAVCSPKYFFVHSFELLFRCSRCLIDFSVTGTISLLLYLEFSSNLLWTS